MKFQKFWGKLMWKIPCFFGTSLKFTADLNSWFNKIKGKLLIQVYFQHQHNNTDYKGQIIF